MPREELFLISRILFVNEFLREEMFNAAGGLEKHHNFWAKTCSIV